MDSLTSGLLYTTMDYGLVDYGLVAWPMFSCAQHGCGMTGGSSDERYVDGLSVAQCGSVGGAGSGSRRGVSTPALIHFISLLSPLSLLVLPARERERER